MRFIKDLKLILKNKEDLIVKSIVATVTFFAVCYYNYLKNNDYSSWDAIFKIAIIIFGLFIVLFITWFYLVSLWYFPKYTLLITGAIIFFVFINEWPEWIRFWGIGIFFYMGVRWMIKDAVKEALAESFQQFSPKSGDL